MSATTRVGRVRTRLKSSRDRETTTRLLMMLVEASTAKGMAATVPMKEPSSDILMVSKSGPQTWEEYFQLGGNISPRMTKNCSPRLARVAKLKPVTLTDTAQQISTSTIISGIRETGCCTVLPFSRVMVLGGKILS